jgi:hypothetical protein
MQYIKEQHTEERVTALVVNGVRFEKVVGYERTDDYDSGKNTFESKDRTLLLQDTGYSNWALQVQVTPGRTAQFNAKTPEDAIAQFTAWALAMLDALHSREVARLCPSGLVERLNEQSDRNEELQHKVYQLKEVREELAKEQENVRVLQKNLFDQGEENRETIKVALAARDECARLRAELRATGCEDARLFPEGTVGANGQE